MKYFGLLLLVTLWDYLMSLRILLENPFCRPVISHVHSLLQTWEVLKVQR